MMRDEFADFADAPLPAKPGEWDDFADAPPAVQRRVARGDRLRATGRVHDGDTFAVEGGGNARLYGVDAFELKQAGRTRAGALSPIGVEARGVLAPYAAPDARVTATGALTYGRPVASLDNGGDAGEAVLRGGYGLATPEYLKADPERLGDYMEAERDARLNRRGAWTGSFTPPSDYRHGTPNPWDTSSPTKPGETQAVFWDEPLPAQGLRPEIAEGWLALHKAPGTTEADILAYAKANGFQIDPKSAARFIRERDARPGAPVNDTLQYRDLPRVITDPKDGATGSALRGFADPINVLDEVGALADTLVPGSGRENLWSSDRRFGDVYANNLDQNRSVLAYDDANHPYARFGGQLVGGLVMPGASVEGVGFRAASDVLRAGGTRFAAEQAARRAVVTRLGAAGAAEGTAAGVGQGEDWQGRVTGGLIGAPVGLALGTGLGLAAPALAKVVGRPFSKLAGREGERAAESFTDGAIDTTRARLSNEAADVGGDVGRADAIPSQAMANEAAVPTLAGPELPPEAMMRPVDRIDLGGDGRTVALPDDTARARATDLRANDVLPLPSNTVASMDEAERIAAGRLEPVRAPNEAETLSRRTIPNATTGAPIAKRGPLDLVTWLRSQGGIRAQGGELERYGIDNASRKGVDFAGGENRLGPLVANDGMTYDQAAERAWEAGFFPDRAERPSVADFLDTLADTHSGRQRAFRPDDLEEVDAFDAARRERIDVEGARAAGSPMVRDRSEPVGYDDLDANTPPVQAYEEWGENAPNLAGNIRLDKLDSPQAIKRALVHTEQRAGGFDAATRGRITQAETKSLAAELGMTADDLLKRRKGQAFNAEEALAARQLLARSGTDLVNMAKRMARVDNPGDEMEAAFREAWLRHAAIQEQVSGMTAEAGRLLQQFRMTADGRDARALSVLGEGLGGATRAKDVADRIVDLERVGTSPGEINKFALASLAARGKDKFIELYINSLLSNPGTHVVNMLSNTLTAMGQLPEHAVAAGIGAARRLVPSQRDTERVLFSELGSRGVGMLVGAKEGLLAAARSFRTGDSLDGITKVETQQTQAIGGRLGSIVRTPTRFLTAEDELFKGIARRMELNGLAIRQAKREGLTGQEARDRAADLAANPSDVMMHRADDYARYLTFQTPLEPGSFASNISKSAQGSPLAKLIFPFIRTPMNLLRFAAERSPAAVALKSWRKDMLAGGARRDLAVARAMVGSGFGAAMYEAAANGQITGGGPADYEARRLLIADGWQPYSFKVGDQYYSYARLDPFSTTIGTVADLVDLESFMTDKQRERSFTLVMAAVVNNLSSKTWLSGISSAMEAVSDPNRYMDNFVARTAGAIAVPAFVAQMARSSDPVTREARGWLDRIKSRVPGLSDDLPARRDAFGRTMESEGGVGPDFLSPIWTKTAKNDPTVAALLKAGAHVTAPRRKVGDRELTGAEYERYSAEVGRIGKPGLDALVSSPAWKAMDQEQQQDAVRKVMKDARAAAKSVIDQPTSAVANEWADFADAPVAPAERRKVDEFADFADAPPVR
jgi:endonuclease YncB( thermonuclease family)